ncbi:MAG TPA: DUF4437 domain-containing protein [Anaeromyxobacteraceae bacterium]|jgi:quercetin dioxygenase-like cupin family protein|nr:DUF4437 domain-containing protein [Anaeromyxobacteraceae bacterium]
MKRAMTWVAAVALFALGAAAGAAGKGRSMAASELEFKPTPTAGISRAVLWGNPETGAYGTLVKFAGGTDVGWHTHGNLVRSVIISGTFITEVKGAPPMELGPGSFVEHPGNEKHRTACKAGADCLFFSTQPGKWDLRPEKTAATP